MTHKYNMENFPYFSLFWNCWNNSRIMCFLRFGRILLEMIWTWYCFKGSILKFFVLIRVDLLSNLIFSGVSKLFSCNTISDSGVEQSTLQFHFFLWLLFASPFVFCAFAFAPILLIRSLMAILLFTLNFHTYSFCSVL